MRAGIVMPLGKILSRRLILILFVLLNVVIWAAIGWLLFG
jgi:hypothetical protein